MAESIKKYTLLKAAPDEVYLALTNPYTVRLWAGNEAVMSDIPGDEFSLFEGAIVGKNIALTPGKAIHQVWYFGEENPATFIIKLHEHKKGTSLEMNLIDVPLDALENISRGIEEVYIASLLDFYEEG